MLCSLAEWDDRGGEGGLTYSESWCSLELASLDKGLHLFFQLRVVLGCMPILKVVLVVLALVSLFLVRYLDGLG